LRGISEAIQKIKINTDEHQRNHQNNKRKTLRQQDDTKERIKKERSELATNCNQLKMQIEK
jgi:hypothetical protein